jgi:hypothetical protein
MFYKEDGRGFCLGACCILTHFIEIKYRKENVLKQKAVVSAWEPAVSSHTPPWAHLWSMEIATHASKGLLNARKDSYY